MLATRVQGSAYFRFIPFLFLIFAEMALVARA